MEFGMTNGQQWQSQIMDTDHEIVDYGYMRIDHQKVRISTFHKVV